MTRSHRCQQCSSVHCIRDHTSICKCQWSPHIFLCTKLRLTSKMNDRRILLEAYQAYIIYVLFNNYSPKVKWTSREIFTNIHEPEANNCFSIITQVIIEIPKRRNIKFYHNLPLLPRCSHQCVTQCLFELALWRKKKTFSLMFIPGKNKSKCGFVVCTLIDNGYTSLLFSQTMFSYGSFSCDVTAF